MLTYGEVKHGFDFVGCEAVFADFTVTRKDGRDAYGEWRWQTLGLWNDVVVFYGVHPCAATLTTSGRQT